MVAERSRVSDEGRIRALIDDWATAVRTKDLDGIMAYYAADIVAFDAISQLQFKGADAYKSHWEACLSFCQGATTFEIHELGIAASDDVAFAHGLTRCGGSGENGEEQTAWMRMTACYRKINGKWRAVHEHFSSPFDMASGKALFGLAP